MFRFCWLTPYAFAGILLFLSGCTLCTNCEDDAYSAYGGIWQRSDRCQGRVGSVFAPAGFKASHPDVSPEEAGEDYEQLPPSDDDTDSETSEKKDSVELDWSDEREPDTDQNLDEDQEV